MLTNTVVLLASDENLKREIRESLGQSGNQCKIIANGNPKTVLETLATEKNIGLLVIDWDLLETKILSHFMQGYQKIRRAKPIPVMFVATEPTQSTVAMSMEYDALHLLMRRSFKAHFKHALTDFVSRGSEADIFQALLDDVEVSLKSKQQSAIDEAVNILRKKFPKNPRAVVEYGNNLLRKSNIAEATAVAEELLAQVPDNVRALSLLARAKLHAKKFDEAIALMERCESLSPEFVDRLILFGEIYWSKGQHKEAREKYEAAIALDAQNVDAKMGVAMTAASMGNEAEALSLLGGSLSRDEIAGFFNNAGIVASHRGRFDESVRLYESAMMQIDNSEQKAKVLFNMGLAHERAGRASEAQSSFEKAQTLAPQMQKAAQHLHQHLHQHSAETPKASSEKITKEKNK